MIDTTGGWRGNAVKVTFSWDSLLAGACPQYGTATAIRVPGHEDFGIGPRRNTL